MKMFIKSLNRTKVELKLFQAPLMSVYLFVFESDQSGIETVLQDLNRDFIDDSLNRTKVELKLCRISEFNIFSESLNRTKVELKPFRENTEMF